MPTYRNKNDGRVIETCTKATGNCWEEISAVTAVSAVSDEIATDLAEKKKSTKATRN